jgi:AraC family transcriptional regulator, regulatory protein of adaptative response / methylated-DNA-[protein]-cysteine methyltransferase
VNVAALTLPGQKAATTARVMIPRLFDLQTFTSLFANKAKVSIPPDQHRRFHRKIWIEKPLQTGYHCLMEMNTFTRERYAISVTSSKQATYLEAIHNRDKAFDGQFVYAVKSTGIYCRPSCPSRKPKAVNLELFGLPELARQAGYRACKRCQPDDAKVSDPQLEKIQAICHYIEHHVEAISLENLSKAFSLSPSYLQRTFTTIVGISPQAYAEAQRMNKIKTALQNGDDISGSVYEAGYGSSSRLYSKAKSELGMTPKTYKQKGRDTLISYTVTDSPLGKLLVAATEKGVCAVRLADTEKELLETLAREFSNAALYRGDKKLASFVKAILANLEGKLPHLDLPLDVKATAFQKRVWQELQKIPYGETRSYGEVAKAIGQPSAVRAVASACASNAVGVVVPCHRVIGADGSLSGYRWGIERKRELLQREAVLKQQALFEVQ